MPWLTIRVYLIGEDGGFLKAIGFYCADDKAAIEYTSSSQMVRTWNFGKANATSLLSQETGASKVIAAVRARFDLF